MKRIAINGVGGRMGQALTQASKNFPAVQLTAAIEEVGHPALGKDIGILAGREKLDVLATDDLRNVCGKFDVLIDFTRPTVTLAALKICQDATSAMVIGTTGLDQSQKEIISVAAEKIPIILAPNMSVGVNLSFKLLDLATRILGNEFDIEIIEAHHRLKVDAPSGTALRMGEIIAAALGRNLDQCAVHGRKGYTGIRESNTIGFASIRAGDIVGEHSVLFADDGEQIEIRHRATSRMTFAHGALRAAVWVAEQAPGLYDMQDVLGLR